MIISNSKNYELVKRQTTVSWLIHEKFGTMFLSYYSKREKKVSGVKMTQAQNTLLVLIVGLLR